MRLDQLIQGNDAVQQHVAAERRKEGLTAVSPMARRAIQQEILPQIEESVISVESAEDLCESTKRSIEAAFSYKNEIYTRLVSYKGIDQSDQQFLDDLLVVMDEWLRSTKAGLRDDEDEDDDKDDKDAVPEKQEVEVKVKVEAEEPEEPKEIVVRDTSSDEQVPLAIDDIFDLGDVRL